MKKLRWLFMAACLLILPALSSCDDNDGYSIGDISYPNWSTVRVTGNAFYLVSDTWGTLWPVNIDLGWYQPVDGQRVLTVFNPLYDNYQGYDHAVKLLSIRNALTKTVETMPSGGENDYGNDPLFIYKGDISIGGGYLNVIFQQNLPKNSQTKHRISLVQSTENQYTSDGYIHLELRYNDYDDLSGYRAMALVSFNLSTLNLDAETIKGVKLKLNSEVNGEVELTFNKKEKAELRNLDGEDFTKMQLK